MMLSRPTHVAEMALSVGGMLTGRREDGKGMASIEDRQGTGEEVGG